MKSITPVNVWHEGTSKEVTKLDVAISWDDMKSYATFVYRLNQVIEAIPPDPLPENYIAPASLDVTIVNGTVYMGGTDYENWDDSNDAAYEYVADKLNLTIVADPEP